jgi:hypothetical protein
MVTNNLSEGAERSVGVHARVAKSQVGAHAWMSVVTERGPGRNRGTKGRGFKSRQPDHKSLSYTSPRDEVRAPDAGDDPSAAVRGRS